MDITLIKTLFYGLMLMGFLLLFLAIILFFKFNLYSLFKKGSFKKVNHKIKSQDFISLNKTKENDLTVVEMYTVLLEEQAFIVIDEIVVVNSKEELE